jgi:hypothetical protein
MAKPPAQKAPPFPSKAPPKAGLKVRAPAPPAPRVAPKTSMPKLPKGSAASAEPMPTAGLGDAPDFRRGGRVRGGR